MRKKLFLHKTVVHNHRQAPGKLKKRAKKIATFLEIMAADGNVNNLVNTIAHHPAFRETIMQFYQAVTHSRVFL